MDKKKVIKLIGNVEKYLLAYEKSGKVSDFSMALQQLHEAENELSKSDWISVEDELPDIGEQALVYSKGRQFLPHIAMRMKTNDYHFDNNGFLKAFHVTHWRRIDKLEV